MRSCGRLSMTTAAAEPSVFPTAAPAVRRVCNYRKRCLVSPWDNTFRETLDLWYSYHASRGTWYLQTLPDAGHCKPLVTSSGPHRLLRAI
jgi:hypothetical protein